MLSRGEVTVIYLLVVRRLANQPIRAVFAVAAVAAAVCLGITLYLATALSDDEFIQSVAALGDFDARLEVPRAELLSVANLARELDIEPSVVFETLGKVNDRSVVVRGALAGKWAGDTNSIYLGQGCFGTPTRPVLVELAQREFQLNPKVSDRIADCSVFVDPALVADAPSMMYLKCQREACEASLAMLASSSVVQKLGTSLQSVGARRAARSLAAAFSANIYLLLLIAALIAAFTIWNSFEISVLSARRDYQALRTLGLSGSAIYISLVLEGALVGLLGGGFGIMALPFAERIYLAAREVLAIHYAAVFTGSEAVSGSLLIYGSALALAVASTTLGAHLPARKAASVAPAIIQRLAASSIDLSQRRWAWVTVVSGLCISISLLFQGQPFMGEMLALGVLGVGVGIIPSLMTLVARFLPYCKVYGALAAGELKSSVGAVVRTTLFIYVAASLVVAMGMMVSSFRGTVDQWIRASFSGDLYVKAENGYLPIELVRSVLRQIQGTDAKTLSLREQALIYADSLISVHGQDLDEAIRLNAIQRNEDSGDRRWREVAGISEPFARKFKQSVGDRITIHGREFKVSFVAKDYSSDRGIVYLDSTVFREMFNHDNVVSLSFFNLRAEGGRIRELVTKTPNVSVNNSGELRSLVLQIFDRTFRVTELVGFIAVALATCGLIFTSLQLALERAPRIQLLRTLGVSRNGIFKTLLITYLAIICVAAILGCVVGWLLGWVLAAVINPTYFGWTIDFSFTVGALAKGPLLLLAFSFAICWIGAYCEARGGGRAARALE